MKLNFQSLGLKQEWVLASFVVLALGAIPLSAADNNWTGAVGTVWSDSGNWSGGTPDGSSNTIFALTPGAEITLSSGSLADSLWFQNDYELSGGTLELTSGGIRVNLGHSVILNSLLNGTSGLTLTGGGSLRLSNASNSYTGITTISNGSLIINNATALGGTGTVNILTTNNTPLNTSLLGFGGGSLVLDGTSGGVTFARNVDFEGRGPIGDRGAAILSLGDNTLSGVLRSAISPLPLSPTATVRSSRINSVNGTLTLSGSLNVGGTAGTTLTSFGGVNSAGVGDYLLSGVLEGTGTLQKSGAGTLFLMPSDTSGFSGRVRISGSATGQQSSLRITSLNDGLNTNSVFGTANGTTTSAPIDLDGGVLEIRSESSLNFAKNFYHRSSGTVYAGPAVGGSGVNGTFTFGSMAFEDNLTNTFQSRNGYGVSFTTAPVAGSTAGDNNSTITNSMGGTLSFTGNFWSNANNTGHRTMTIGGNGNTIINGNIVASAAAFDHILTKSGTGVLTITGVGSTLDGAVNSNGGAIAITDFRSLGTSNTSVINIGTGSTASALIVGTATTGTAGGQTTSRVINLAGTTGGASLYANQPGTNPVVINSNIVSTGVGTKTLTLGGSNTSNNILNGSISNAAVAFTPSANAASGATVLALTSVTGLAVGQNVAGTGIQAGTTITAISGLNVTLSLPTTAARTTEALNAATGGGSAVSVTKIGSGTWVLAGPNSYTGTTTIANGTLKLMANAETSTILPATNAVTFNQTNSRGGSTLEFVGQNAVNNVQTLGLLTTTAGANTIRLTAGTSGTASLVFSSLATSSSSTLNIVGADYLGNTVTIAGADGLISRTIYWNGSDYAYRQSNILRAPVYDTDSGFVTAGASLASGNNLINADISGQSTHSAVTLKFNGSRTLGLDTGATLTLTGAGILATGGSSVISGGSALATGSQALVVRVNQEFDTLTIGSLITGTGGLTVQGAGTLILSAANTRTGTTTINEGIVQLSGAGRLGNAADLTIRHLGTYDLNGVTPATNINAFNNAGSVINSNTTTATLTVGGSNGTGTSFGTIEGAINVVKIGTGGQSWLGLSSYSGSTTIGSSGLVTVDVLGDIGQDSGIGRGDATNAVTNAASLVFNGASGGLVYQGTVRNGDLALGSLSASTDRLFTLAATATGATLSSTVSNNNAIVWSNTGAIVNNTTANATLILTGTSTGDNTLNPQLVNSSVGGGVTLSVNKTAAGQWNLGNGNNSYTGVTTVGNGILALNHNGALPANSPVVLGTTTTNGILQLSGTFARNLTATPAAGTGSITWGGTTGGGGFAAHSTPLTVTLNSGAGLTWGSGGFVPTGAALVLNSASALSNVTFTNSINFGAIDRTITINDNANTGADFATLNGVLSGAGGGLLKNGAGVLRLGNANSYTGLTQVQAGTLVVSSLGSSTGSATSSVGAGGVVMGDANAIQLGAGGNNSGILQYVGTGETSDRKIRFNSTTGSSSTNQIHADGIGPLILTNVANDMTAGAKTVVLRGSSAAGNMITSNLADNGGALSVTVDGGATWILTGTNTFTGNLIAGGGALGIGGASAVGAGKLVVTNGNVFAHGADRVIGSNLDLTTNAVNGWLGDYGLTFNGNNVLTGTGTTSLTVTTNNSIATGKSLTLNGVTSGAGANRTWTVDGTGETIINGVFTSSTAFGVAISKTGNGILTLGTNGTTSNWNLAGNNVTLNRGVLKFTNDNAIPSATAANGGLVMNPAAAVGATATLDLNGTTQTVNAFTGNTNGILKIDNTSASAATFRFGANNAGIDFGSGVGTYSVLNTGTGSLSLVKLGNTSATFISGITLAHKGITASEGGGVFTLASPVTATTGLRVIEASTLALTGGLPNGNLITSVEVGGGSSLSLLDGAGNKLPNLTSLSLGNTGTGNVTLNLNIGDLSASGDNLNTDFLGLLTGGTLNLGNTITFNMTDAGLNPLQTYTLLNVADGGLSGLGLGNFIQGATPGGFSGFTWNVTDNLVQISTGTLITGDLFWRGLAGGGTDNAWNTGIANWSLDKANTNPATTIPGQGTDVIFAINTASGAVTTTLEQNFKINSLTFEAGTSTPTSVNIAPGAVSTSRLEISPQLSVDGIAITAGGPAAVTISAPLRLGSDQTWNVADAVDLTSATFATGSSNVTVADTTNLRVGMSVLGAGIPVGATVASITNGTSFVLSANTTAAGSGIGLEASSTLTLSNSLQGQADVIKTGAGKVILTAAADPTFNGGQTATFTITGGNLEFTNSAAFGTSANNNVADIVVSGGAFYYNNATAGTAVNLPHSITLSGGALSGGGANHTYGGIINVTSASTINMADSNGPLTSLARNITLAGGLVGSGDLTLNSNNAASSGNQIGGTLTINQDNSSWSGDWNILRGTVSTNNSNGLGSGGLILLEKGRIQLTAGAGTPTISQDIMIASSTEPAVGEFNLANGIATTFSGEITLGGSGGAGELRVFMSNDAATATLTGGVVLANNGGISTQNAATRLLDVNSVISEVGGTRALTINDAAWGGTAATVRLSAANTYTGGTILARGILQINHVDALSSGPLNATGASTFNSLVDLTGGDALTNALNLSAVLTFTGGSGVTFDGITTNLGSGGITNSLTAGDLLFTQVNLAELSAAARTLTIAGASSGSTTITSLLNNEQNNTLTNNLTGNSLFIGAIAISEASGTGRTLTLGGTGNTTVTGVIENVTGGGGTAGTIAKVGNGILTLQGDNTFNGPVTIAAGVLEFGTVTNIGGSASNLGQGNAISMTGGTLRFIGTSVQSTNRPITSATGAVTLSANGATVLDTITFGGAINIGPTASGSQLVLTGATGRQGIITGGFTQTGTSADMSVTGGTWTLSGTQSTVADDFIVSGVGTVLNLNSTDIVRIMSGSASADLTIRSGAVVNINALNAVQYTATPYRLFVGQGADGADAILNLNANLQSGRFILGERGTTRVGIVNGPGTLTVDNAAASFIELYRGEVNANLASNGTGAGIFRKVGSGTVTLRGDNTGLTNTGITQVDNGTLALDFSLNNASKLNAAQQLDMRGATLQIIGNSSAATLQSVASFTMATGAGNNIIDVTAGTGQTATLDLKAITRAASAGTLRINLNNTGAVVITSTLNTNGIVGSAGYTTVKDSTGTWFGTNSTNLAGGSIVALASIQENAIGNWANGAHISDQTTGFTGTVSASHLNSLRFNAAGGSSVNLSTTGVLTVGTGGILVTDQVSSGSPGLFGGTLGTGATEVIVTQDSLQTFEISSRIGVNNSFTKTGLGTVLLSGNNAYTGQTSIQNATLQISGGNAIGDTSVVTLASNRNSTLQLLANETIGRLQGGQRATNSDYGMVDIGVHTLTINHAGGNTTYAGRFIGSGGLVMSAASASNLTLSGISTGYTGTVEVNGGLFQIVTSGQMDASSITINGNGMMLIDNNGTTSSTTRILNSTPIVLNSAAGGGTNIRGLWVRNTDNDSSRFETIGDLVFNSGASYLTGEANVGTGNARAGIIANDFIRNANATVSVRGRNLGTTTTHHNQFRIGTSANQTAFIAGLTGGAGASGTSTLSIVPWAVGETHNATTTSSANMGNSLVTYVSGAGFRPLDLTTEYASYATAGAANNTRESITADLTALVGRTLNSLVIHNNSAASSALNFTGAGAGQGLTNTSGTFLFTLNPSAAASSLHSVTLGGFDSGISVGSSEYVFFVQNPSAATTTPTLVAQIASALTSLADITKSGRGSLVLSQVNSAGGGANKTTLNEGTLEIADLDHIGGPTGNLVFAGGTLRLGSGFADDLSNRTISFLTGGGTLDTNGIDVTLANSLGSGAGGFTKTGAGNLTLNSPATYTGNSILALGTVTLGANNALGNGGNLTLAAGTTLALGTNSVTHNLVTTGGASPVIAGTGTINASSGFAFNHTGDTQIDAVLAGAGGLLKTQNNIVTLTGLSSYTGTTEVRAGGLSFNSLLNVNAGASALGNPDTVENGIIRMGLTSAATSLTYTGSGHASDRLIGMQGTTGGVTLNGSGTGAVGYGGARFETPGNKTLTLRGSSDPAVINSIGALTEVGGVLTLNKTDANTWQISQASSYSGVTQVDNGALRIGVNDALPIGTTVRLGTGSTSGTLNLNGFDQTIGSLLSQTNSAVASNTLSIGTGKTLTVTGAVTIGANAAGATTLFSATGGGSFVNNNNGGTFQIGGGTGGTNTNVATVDFSGLSNFTVNVGGTGTFRVGDSNTNSSGSPAASSTLILASANNSITAGTLNIGQGTGQGGADQALKLGAGINTINADIINIGGNTTRSGGSLEFAGAGGTVTIRGSDGVSATNVSMVNGAISTGIANQTDFLLAGHTADVLIDTLTMAAKSASTGTTTANFTFNDGTLDIATLNMTRNTGAYSGTATSNVTIGGGATTIDSLAMALNTSSGAGSAVANFNVSGGTVTIGTGSGTAINMANAAASRIATSNITLTGGAVNVTGNVIRNGGAGAENATVTLNGATLNMSGYSMGTSGQSINFAAQAGSLSNLGELNGGGVLEKTTSGTLVLGDGNLYSGGTLVSAGTLLVNNTSGSGTGSGDLSVAIGGTLGGSGIVASSNTSAAVTIQGLLDVGNPGDTGGADLAFNLTGGSSSISLGGVVQLDLWSGLGLGGGVGTAFSDQLWLSANSIDLTGSTLKLTNSSGMSNSTFAVGDTWKLFDWNAVAFTGSFSNITSGSGNFLDLPDLDPYGLAWDTSALYTTGHIAVGVPEPSRTLLLMVGLLIFGLRRRRWL